jgi:predicted alpha/beta-hydrolase family hydrolase
MLVSTPRGDARIEVHQAKGKARALLALGHGAGGDVDAPDITAVRDAAVAAGVTVVLITQPYRVAGRRAPAPAGQLDEAWLAALSHLPGMLPAALVRPSRSRSVPAESPELGALLKVPLIVGGRSSGARVACRTALASGAAGVINLAFPLHPPGKPERSRDEELRECGVPALVINGDSDPFGVPEPGPGVDLVIIPGARHDLRKDTNAVAAAVVGWLRDHGWAA